MKHVKGADSNCVGTNFFVAKPTACYASLPFLNAYLPLRDFHWNVILVFMTMKLIFSIFLTLKVAMHPDAPLYYFTLSKTRLFY